MENRIRPRPDKSGLRERQEPLSEFPRVPSATRGGSGLVLISAGRARKGGNAPAGRRASRNMAKSRNIRASVQALKSRDIRCAVEAARSLIQAGGSAVPPLLGLLERQNSQYSKRALFVLHNIDWGKVDDRKKEMVIQKLCFPLFRFENGGRRTPESLISESIIQRMGPIALPFFAALLRNRKPASRLIGLSALLDIDWETRGYRNVSLIEKALEGMKDDPVLVFRDAARIILRKIRMTYLSCRESRASWDCRDANCGDAENRDAECRNAEYRDVEYARAS